MGPPPFGDGNVQSRAARLLPVCCLFAAPLLPLCCLFAAPSMGPPPFGDGNMVTIDGQRYTPFSASMGPPPFGDGNMTDPKTGVTVEVKLQWGHRLSAMETRRPNALRDGGDLASMGPPPFGDGNLSIKTLAEWTGGASMGPPPFGDGNHGDQAQVEDPETASMGPPPFGDGNQGWGECAKVEDPGFNGATAFRRWKHLYGCPLCCHLVSLQWGHRLSAMETARDLTASIALQWCFNGATAFRRWKQGHKEIRFTPVQTLQWSHRLSAMETLPALHRRPVFQGASMGPPPFGDGNLPPSRPQPRIPTRFNGATAFRRWKPDGSAVVILVLAELQWGHRLSAMETLNACAVA